MTDTNENVTVEEDRDAWESIARERNTTLEKVQAELAKLKADRSIETIRSAGRLATLAWILMVIMIAFASIFILSNAIRASAKTCPTLPEKP